MTTSNFNSVQPISRLFAKTKTAIQMLDLMKQFFATTKNQYKITRKAQSKSLFNDLTLYIMRNMPTMRNPYTLSKQLSFYGIENHSDLSKALLEQTDDFLEQRFNFKNIYELSKEKLDRMDLIGRQYIKEHGKGVVIDPSDEITEEDQSKLGRTIVVRSKYGNGPVMTYSYDGPIRQNSLNQIKMAYRYETGVSYYEARPILLSSWLKLDEEHKNATCPLVDGDSDLQEISI